MYVATEEDVCTEELVRFIIIVVVIIIIIIIIILGGYFIYLFFNFISKLVMFVLYLNSCKIYLSKVAELYCVILF